RGATVTGVQTCALPISGRFLRRGRRRLAFPAADDLFEETFRPLTGNFVDDEVCQIGGERFSGSLGPGLRCGRDFVRNIEVQLGRLEDRRVGTDRRSWGT